MKMSQVRFRKMPVYYNDTGSGKAVVLLHGFTECSRIWADYSERLARKYRVITIDLPGHGKSARIEAVHTMDLMAEVVHAVLKKAGVGRCTLIGHSMGGYVTLAFASKYPEMLRAIGLFHSHCFADSKQDVANRNRTISIVDKDRYSFISQFIPGLFPLEVHAKYEKQITGLVRRAGKMEKESVIAALEGMKSRKDHSTLLRESGLPVLFILGRKDSKAPVSRFFEMISLPAVSHVLLMGECGHMGFIEFPELCFEAVQGFLKAHS